MEAARQRVAQVRRLGVLAAALLLAGCGSSSPSPPHGGPTLRLALPVLPRTLDPARVADLPSLNVAHELYAGLTRFSGRGVEPDLAESWEHNANGSVWTFHLRKGLRWSDDRPIRAQEFRTAWLRALAPETHAALAGPALGIVRGARRFHATGSGLVGVEAPDDRTLRVTLQHPVPWFDQLVAYPIAFPAPPRTNAFSGPFRLVSKNEGRLVLERNFNYWNAAAVKPSKLVLGTSTNGVDAILPRGLAPPGLPWIETAPPVAGPGWKPLPTLSVNLLWMVTARADLADPTTRAAIASLVGDATLVGLVPRAMPGHDAITRGVGLVVTGQLEPMTLTLAYTTQDPEAEARVKAITAVLGRQGVSVEAVAFPTLARLVQAAGPPARSDIDLVLLGWSSKILDAYNIFDLFPCRSAFNVGQWCDRSYDALMRQTVRTLGAPARYRFERDLLQKKLRPAVPAVPLSEQVEHVHIAHGVRGFRWSPIGFYELMGMTRS